VSYEIERSFDNENFKSIGSIDAKGGTVSKDLHYSFIDNQPYLSGYNYYRIKVIDKDGTVTYSAIAKVSFDAKIKTVNIYPNPAHNETTVQINDVTGKKLITINDLSGKIVYSTEVYQTSTEQTFKLTLSNLTKGMYFIKVISDSETLTDKLLMY